jgi:malate synthase
VNPPYSYVCAGGHVLGDEVWEKGRPEETKRIFEQVALSDDFPNFLTLPAYELID